MRYSNGAEMGPATAAQLRDSRAGPTAKLNAADGPTKSKAQLEISTETCFLLEMLSATRDSQSEWLKAMRAARARPGFALPPQIRQIL